MKNIHIKKMEQLRSINLRIGFAAALLISILAFNWVSPTKGPLVWEGEELPGEVTIKPFVVNEPRQPDQQAVKVLRPNDILLEVKDLKLSLQPSTLAFDSTAMVDSIAIGQVVFPKNPPLPVPLPPDETDEGENPWVIIAEEMPRFPGCEDKGLSKKEANDCATALLLKYMYAHVSYPHLARQAGFEGTVYIKFVVERDGSITNAHIARDIGGGCGEEALRVVNGMPKWLPGKQRGRPVRVQFTLPVKFKLD